MSGAWEIVFLKEALEMVLQCEAVVKLLMNHTHSQKEPHLPHFISTMENEYKAEAASEENFSNPTVLQ